MSYELANVIAERDRYRDLLYGASKTKIDAHDPGLAVGVKVLGYYPGATTRGTGEQRRQVRPVLSSTQRPGLERPGLSLWAC